MSKKWLVAHAHYKGEPSKRFDFDADFAGKNKVYRCPKCKKVIAGIETGRRERLYVLAKDVVVDVG